MTTDPAPQWLFPMRKQRGDAPPAEARLLVLPYAAAGAASLRPLVAGLPPEIEVLGVSLPGRERRFSEPPVTGHDEIVAAVTRELAAREPLPTWLFGHSMGASLALACALAAPELCHGVVTSARKPGGLALESLRGLDDEAIVGFFGSVGNTAPKLLEDPFWRARLIELFRSDIALDEEVSTVIEDAPLHLPVLALGGADDPYVPAAELSAWERRTTGDCRVVVLPGAHFYLLDPANREAVQDALVAALHSAVPADAALPVR
ncbi:thioesterase [Streptacidiphilus pinicola]|uniref:Thioesterase n=1 Tax=Streptacidiphilus pinicola TaxID=2219663 RepID=A0A2X0IUR9_9ACTN|nr:alpha/beta fold hydrolase [Streptacidiphilus pinicola]RAG87121.1 thioesterase [Streptacidiphilus pinicola]